MGWNVFLSCLAKSVRLRWSEPLEEIEAPSLDPCHLPQDPEQSAVLVEEIAPAPFSWAGFKFLVDKHCEDESSLPLGVTDQCFAPAFGIKRCLGPCRRRTSFSVKRAASLQSSYWLNYRILPLAPLLPRTPCFLVAHVQTDRVHQISSVRERTVFTTIGGAAPKTHRHVFTVLGAVA